MDNSQITNRMRSRDYDMMPRVWRAMPWPSSDLQISWSSEYINSTYNAPGVQSPVIDSLINQIIAAQEIKKITAVGTSTGSRINVELLHAANVVHGGRPSRLVG